MKAGAERYYRSRKWKVRVKKDKNKNAVEGPLINTKKQKVKVKKERNRKACAGRGLWLGMLLHKSRQLKMLQSHSCSFTNLRANNFFLILFLSRFLVVTHNTWMLELELLSILVAAVAWCFTGILVISELSYFNQYCSLSLIQMPLIAYSIKFLYHLYDSLYQESVNIYVYAGLFIYLKL